MPEKVLPGSRPFYRAPLKILIIFLSFGGNGMSVWLQDDVCPPRTSFATYNAVRSAQEYRVYPFAGHGVPREHESLKDKWIARLLGVGQTVIQAGPFIGHKTISESIAEKEEPE